MMNIAILQGRLVQDPQVRRTDSGKTCTSFTVAVDRDYGDKQADFLDCVAWQQTGDFVDKYFMKGDPIVVQGRLQTRTWEDKQGAKRKATEIIVDHVHFCGGSKRRGKFSSPGRAAAQSAGDYGILEDYDEGLPF